MTVVLTDELERRANNKDRVLRALRDAGPAGLTNVELVAIGGMRAGSRVHELRDSGHVITCEPVAGHGGVWRYTLHPASTPVTPSHWSSRPNPKHESARIARVSRGDRVQLVEPDASPDSGCLF